MATKWRNKADDLREKLKQHQTTLTTQYAQFQAELQKLKDEILDQIVVLDYSTFNLMDRKSTHVLCACVITRETEFAKDSSDRDDGKKKRKNRNGVTRKYVCLVDLPLVGRPRDGLLYAVSLLVAKGFVLGKKVSIWSDSGGSDFHNSACIFAFAQLGCTFPLLDWTGLNFFGPRHGWYLF
jgi:hypothetical protein